MISDLHLKGFIDRLLQPRPKMRMTVRDALKSDFLKGQEEIAEPF